MASLSCPASFGDIEEPTIEQDAAVVLKHVLFRLAREHGSAVRDCASYAIRALGENDGLTSKDLGDAIAFELDLELVDAPLLAMAIEELVSHAVLHYRNDRLYLNPAVTEVVTREVFR